VTAARPRALGVAAWTVDAEPDMRRMVDLGVDILITNRPAVARRLTGR
jgi:glycerophosphoryl diester phosphodiesterase